MEGHEKGIWSLDRRGALSSAVEHFLHTEGVAGSNPAARTTYRLHLLFSTVVALPVLRVMTTSKTIAEVSLETDMGFRLLGGRAGRKKCAGPCMKSPTLGGLLFGPQFAHLAHSPQWGVSPFLRQESEISY